MKRFACLAAAGASLLATGAVAQSIQYSQWEALFGEPVTTGVTGQPQRASDAPAALTIVSSDDIRRSGAVNLAQVLRRFAGIDVTQFSADFYDVAVRGGNQPGNPRLLVLVNGRQVYLDHFGFTNWAGIGIQLEEIQQVEIVRGPTSALFGFNASSGVVNIITANPLLEGVQSLRVEGGPEGERYVSGVVTVPLTERLKARLSGGYGSRDDYDEIEDYGRTFAGLLPDDVIDPDRLSFAADIWYQLTPKAQLNFEMTYSNTESVFSPPTSFDLAFTARDTFSYTGRLVAEGSWGLFNAIAYYNSMVEDLDVDNDGEFDDFTSDQGVIVFRAENTFKLTTDDTIRGAIEFRDNRLTIIPEVAGSGRERFALYAASGTWEHVFGPTLTGTGAVRVDHLRLGQRGEVSPFAEFTAADFDRTITTVSFNTGLVWRASDLDLLRVNIGRGIQAPSLIALGVVFPVIDPETGAGLTLNGNPLLDPATSLNFEVGYRRTLGTGWAKLLDLSAFYVRNREVQIFGGFDFFPANLPDLPDVVAQQVENRGAFNSYGLEVALSGGGETVTWDVNYTLNFVDEDVPDNAVTLTVPESLEELTPRHKANLRLGYQDGPFTADVFGRYRSGTSFFVVGSFFPFGPPIPEEIGSAVTADARIAYRPLETLELSVTGENIFSDAADSVSVIGSEPRVRLGLRLTF